MNRKKIISLISTIVMFSVVPKVLSQNSNVTVNVHDTTTVSSVVVFPIDESVVDSIPSFYGTATSSANTSISQIYLSLRDNMTGQFWNPQTFSWENAEKWFLANGTTSWNFSGSMPTWIESRNYTIRSRATAQNGFVETPGVGNDFTFETFNPLRISPEYVQIPVGTQIIFNAYNGNGTYNWTTNSIFGSIYPTNNGTSAIFTATNETPNSFTEIFLESGSEIVSAKVIITSSNNKILDLIPDFSVIEQDDFVNLIALGGLSTMPFSWEVKNESGQIVSGFLDSVSENDNMNKFTGIETGIYFVKVINNGLSDTVKVLVLEKGRNLLDVNPNILTLDVGETGNFFVVNPTGNVFWSSLDPSVVGINGSSNSFSVQVKGISEGNGNVLVRDSNGNYGVGFVSVTDGDQNIFFIDPHSAVLPIGSAIPLSVYGGVGSISWRMTNQTVGTTHIISDRKAIFTAVAEGSVDIVVRDENGEEIFSRILVVKFPPIVCDQGSTNIDCVFSENELYVLPNFIVLPIGESKEFEVFNAKNDTANWSLTNSNKGSLNQIYGKKVIFNASQVGTVDLTADDGEQAGTARIMIFDPLDPPPTNRNFTVVPTVVLYPGQQTQMNVAGPASIVNGNINWSSMDSSIATIDPETGIVVAGSNLGTTTIIARTESGEEAYATVITTNPNEVLDVQPKFLEIDIGDTAQLSVSGGAGPIQYVSTNTGIATVDSNGVVRGIAVGNATIIVMRSGLVGFSNVTVRDPNLVRFHITPNYSDVPKGTSQILVPKDFNGDPNDIVWTSSDPENFEIVPLTSSDVGYEPGAVKVFVKSESTYGTIKAVDANGSEATATIHGVRNNSGNLTNNPTSVTFSQVGECLTIEVLNKSPGATKYSFSSANPTYLSVDSNGKICVQKLPENPIQIIVTTTEEETGRTATTTVTILGRNSADSDGDGMPDWWEDQFGCMNKNFYDCTQDYDKDGWTNMEEYLAGSNPCEANSIPTDTDKDGMPDWWEKFYKLNPNNASDRDFDPDKDNLTNYEEYKLVIKKYCGTSDPHDSDTDNDGFLDGNEIKNMNTNPLRANTGRNPNTGSEISILFLLSVLIAIKLFLIKRISAKN